MGATASVFPEEETPRDESLMLDSFLDDPVARNYFLQYIVSEESETSAQVQRSFVEVEKEPLKILSNNILQDFIHHGKEYLPVPANVVSKIKGSFEKTKENEEENFKQKILPVQESMSTVRAIGLLSGFGRSEYYGAYLKQLPLAKRMKMMTIDEGEPNEDPMTMIETCGTYDADVGAVRVPPGEVLTDADALVVDGIRHIARLMSDEAMAGLMGQDTWLGPLFASMDRVPISICFCAADPSRKGFPIIFVNKEFEECTGYKNADVVGSKCSFLQDGVIPDSMQEAQLLKIRNNLAAGKPVKAVLTNKKKDGTIFQNLLSMKPVFDQNGVYRYVVSAQYDVHAQSSTAYRLYVTAKFLESIPNTVYVGAGNPFKASRKFLAFIGNKSI